MSFDHVGLVEGSALFLFLKQAAHALNKTIKTRIRVGNFESLCRMVEADVGVGIVPEYAARRYSRHMDIRVVSLVDEWATRDLQICVRSLEALPLFAKWLVDALLADSRNAADRGRLARSSRSSKPRPRT